MGLEMALNPLLLSVVFGVVYGRRLQLTVAPIKLKNKPLELKILVKGREIEVPGVQKSRRYAETGTV